MTPCRLCRQGPTHVRFNIDSYTILVCESCRGAFVEPLPDPSELVRYYDRSYYEGGKEVSYASYELSESVARTEFRHLVAAVSPGANQGWVVELGCAYGYLLSELQDSHRSLGVEISFAAALEAQRRGVRVVVAESGRLPLCSNFASEVFMIDMIEHVADPLSSFQEARRLLRKGGRLILTTGDYGSLLARVSGRRWRLLTPPSHLSFFTIRALREGLGIAGFRVLTVQHPWKRISVGLMLHQIGAWMKLRNIRPATFLHRVTIPVNLWDAFRVIAVAE